MGDRYQILEMLGKGGIGEVWHAFDLKLRVEVALKALREDLFKDERRLEMLRQEVRAAREVMSPNVCRIFDLVEAEGSELVSMEYIDGATLLEVLQDRGPLELKEAQEIASQFLAGLEAILSETQPRSPPWIVAPAGIQLFDAEGTLVAWAGDVHSMEATQRLREKYDQ